MSKVNYTSLEANSKGFYGLMGILIAVILAGLGAAYYMEHNGHWVTGMNNQIVWGTPHVFAIFLIVAASGALNVASIGTVFGKAIYKPLGRMSSLLAISLLIGGLMVLVLDLGRPDRLIEAMTLYNFKSIFAWNIILYNGFIAITVVYIWFMMEKKMNKYYKAAGFVAFIWRLILTTGTGSIFGFLVARSAYDAAIMAPLFIALSFSLGMACFILFLMATYKWSDKELGDAVINRLKNVLGIFVAAVFYFVLAYHLTNLYATQHHGFERFILAGPSGHTPLFWVGQMLIGTAAPLLIFYTKLGQSRTWIAIGAALVIIGGFAQLVTIIIGGQAYPMPIFPDMDVISSSFGDAAAYFTYTPSLPEIVLGFGGVAIAIIIFVFGCAVLRFLPTSLADNVADPHHKAESRA
ncbi:MAG TPA: molybdopterin oxidoreductase [Gammaproteobacteria bacterium]|nr:molybdopterin oxidoreductase [Gammaproteobacteria bacterium]